MPEQLELFAILNPCRGICQTDERGGCFRNRSERFSWDKMSDMQKQNILRLCQQRMKRLQHSDRADIPAEFSQLPFF
ncbi:DUF1289 domain-containing protein [Pectobacterium parvum]|uniref:DUF1289 domain-containing protein n=1 Tax=Pectobacterium parvum TaxID=2778550 RepID=UPI00301A22E5